MTQTKARDVQVLPIASDTTVYRSRSWNRLRFEIEYAREKGTTANSYLIRGDQTALIDPPGASFTEIFLKALQHPEGEQRSESRRPLWSDLWAQLRWVVQQYAEPALQPIDLTEVDYLILGHVNPNRIETLKVILAQVPQVKLVCSNPAAIALKTALPDQPLNLKVIKGADDVLDLGRGHRLRFLPLPTPRYPDELATYDPHTQILYTDKFFGAHVCGDEVFDTDWETLKDDRRYYFDCLMAPHARQVEIDLERLAEVAPVRGYAPGHGPIVREVMEITNAYRAWCEQQKGQSLMVALLYASAYGNTATLAQAIARGLTKAGARVESINCEVADPEDIRAIAEQCEGFLIGSPTLGGHAPTQVQTALGIMLSNVPTEKYAGVFGSFGWSGEAIDYLEEKLKDAGYPLAFEPLRIKFKPTDAVLQMCEETGTDFVQTIKKAKKRKKATQLTAKPGVSPTSPLEQAVGRIVGSLCVVTAQQGDVSSAMLASWVSQATFSPPGFTVAVARDRAIESLLYPDSRFVLNILPDGGHLPLMKHFLKPFSPGEDRFAGVETKQGENGCPILLDASAYLECRVASRMECGDHWVVYSTVERGEVLNAEVKTAVHHRKSGVHY
ncbi:MAG: diflavin flavoprotein [Synechococcales bacterium]|nr:diflavin flavoprotein [Synechococcales bacterium]